MSTGQTIHERSSSSASKRSHSSRPSKTRAAIQPPQPALTPENGDQGFEPCAATASFLLYAQRSRILVVHHDTLAIERRFDLHREDIVWIQVDNASERGCGRLAVSYDAGSTAIVWDIFTGGEIARFSAYEHMRVASFLRNGNIAFGNDQGNIILFEPSTSEHIAARTIFDPVTALAPSFDCRTFAIGYLNGSILVATLQPSFTILHTLTTNRAPSRITGLSWHGSSSKQKTDMLATQTSDGDLRVWSVPKVPHQDLVPTIIRVLQRAELQAPGPCWFAWSKNGRIVQYAEGETRAWDVRTKRVTFEVIPTADGIVAMANFGATATLFTLGRNHTVQQYDVTPGKEPMQVCSVAHPPSNTPPTPPTDFESHSRRKNSITRSSSRLPTTESLGGTESSADEGGALSPLQKIAKEMDTLDALESELRDKITPLSPSSKASSVSSKSSRESRRARRYLYDLPDSSRASTTTGYNGTEFSQGEILKRSGHESMSIRSVSSLASRPQHVRTSSLRREVMRSPDELTQYAAMDLFPFTKARLREVDFRTPHYGDGLRTADLLQREMLSTVFGWHEDIRSLIEDELSRHRSGSASAVLLAKWLGDVGADSMASMVGSESMTSSDWMLLALSSIGKDSQKKVGEAFVQRLLEKGDIHPAVAILLGLGEYDDAIEVYVSMGYWMEALLLSCLQNPSDWGRQAFLVRKWGEIAVQQGQAELAVRCFSCAAAETSVPWVSPRAQQEAAFAAQEQKTKDPGSIGYFTSPPNSPPSRSASGRLTAKNASLKLITSFGEKITTQAPNNNIGTTPIAESALSPGGGWRQARPKGSRDPSSARTATPGGFVKRRRLPSRDQIERAQKEAAELVTPMTASREFTAPPPPTMRPDSRTSNTSLPEPATALRSRAYDVERLAPIAYDESRLLSPIVDPHTHRRVRSNTGNDKRTGLAVDVVQTRYLEARSPAIELTKAKLDAMYSPSTDKAHGEALSPSLTDKSNKTRAIDNYINSVDEARSSARRERSRAPSRKRGDSRRREDSRPARTTSRSRDTSAPRPRDNMHYIKAPKRSPASPVPMSPDEVARAGQKPAAVEPATTDDEEFYKVASPIVSPISPAERHRGVTITRPESRQARTLRRETSRQRIPLPADRERGRNAAKGPGALERSPSMPLPISPEKKAAAENDDTESDGRRFRIRAVSSNRGLDNLQSRRAASREDRDRSSSRRQDGTGQRVGVPGTDLSHDIITEDQSSVSSMSNASSGRKRFGGLSRRELAAKELEDRRLSLARRPSAPQIPMPLDFQPPVIRPSMAPRSNTELGDSPRSAHPPLSRSHTVEPEPTNKSPITIKPMLPPMGLPATPRAMRNPRPMGSTESSEQGAAPPVPDMPFAYSEISSGGSITGSALSQITGSNLSQTSSIPNQASYLTQPSQVSGISNPPRSPVEGDGLAALLPSTVFGQKGQGLPRSASAPIDNNVTGVHPAYKSTLPSTRRLSAMRGNVRKISPPDNHVPPITPVSIDETIANNEQQILVLNDEPTHDDNEPPILPELQHLAGPPPPPPPPMMFHNASTVSSDIISIAIGGSSASELSSTLPSTHYPTSTPPHYPQPMERSTTSSPTSHRQGRGSVSETFGSRFRGYTDRMRSQSRSRAKSPPTGSGTPQPHAPYESIPPPMPAGHHSRSGSVARAKSPYELAMTAGGQDQQLPPPPPPPMPDMESKLSETSIPPSTLPSSRSGSTNGYRNPKDIRANMPPETLQQGVQNGGFL
ncbi:hypothetical protein LTR78_002012 [Recurvomyces mirabilis]|uniref:Gem-associated protein 5 TPR domain-containing protein n=1 Tax=Recurvomyces mirabilis TaxID=574656 RepID=A0AAE0WU77_9PEZI|nr:hypothetical protein LTR78_002012 [Recurvomyces mirabilis]KAK5160470.1 hypothetical protein LTS14_001482 [Recurvomyces mirabilis]